jgi:hypothetical protein
VCELGVDLCSVRRGIYLFYQFFYCIGLRSQCLHFSSLFCYISDSSVLEFSWLGEPVTCMVNFQVHSSNIFLNSEPVLLLAYPANL